MRATRLLGLAALLSAATVATASEGQGPPLWWLEECTASEREADTAAREALRAAGPKNPTYLPKPFPSDRDGIIENFVFQYEEIWGDKSLEHPLLWNAVRGGVATYQVIVAANWKTERCGRGEREINDKYFILNIFGDSGNALLARAILRSSGRFVHLVAASNEYPVPELASLSKAKALAEAITSQDATSEQHVILDGSVHCSFVQPCVSMRSGKDVFIYESNRLGERLYRGGQASERFDSQALHRSRRLPEIARQLARMDQAVVSTGRNFMAVQPLSSVDRRPK